MRSSFRRGMAPENRAIKAPDFLLTNQFEGIEWSHTCGNSSAGRAPRCQRGCRGSESRFPLHKGGIAKWLRQRSAKPLFTSSNLVAASSKIKGLALRANPFCFWGRKLDHCYGDFRLLIVVPRAGTADCRCLISYSQPWS